VDQGASERKGKVGLLRGAISGTRSFLKDVRAEEIKKEGSFSGLPPCGVHRGEENSSKLRLMTTSVKPGFEKAVKGRD